MIGTLVARSFGPHFHALPCLEVATPVADIRRSILILVLPVPEALVILPLAFIAVTILVIECALPMRKALLPITFISRTIFPGHNPLPMPEASPHFAFVDGPGGIVDVASVLRLGPRIVSLVVFDGFEQLLLLEVLAVFELHFVLELTILLSFDASTYDGLEASNLHDNMLFHVT